MASSDRIADALESVSVHLEAIELLGGMLSCVEDSGSRKYQYDFCLAFQLLGEAARAKLECASAGVDGLMDEAKAAAAFRADLNALSRASGAR